jgi:hypothetical protein
LLTFHGSGGSSYKQEIRKRCSRLIVWYGISTGFRDFFFMISSTAKNTLIDYNTGIGLEAHDYENRALDGQFRIFAVLWAIASLFHMAHSSVFDTSLNFALLTVASLYAIFRPSLAGFLLMIGLQVFDAFYRMPFTTNHWIFTAFVNITILHCLLYLIVRKRTFQINSGSLLKTFIPLVKIELIVLYFFAVFHKLNTGFFADGSCATDLLRAQHLDDFIALSPGFYKLNAYLTLVIESMIPLLLCFGRTRSFGILVGLFFHCVLSYSSYNAFYDFSSMVFAVYFLFTAPDFGLRIAENLARIKNNILRTISPKDFTVLRLLGLVFGFLMGLGVVYVLTKKLADSKSVHLYFFWTVYSLLYFYLFIKSEYFDKRTSQRIRDKQPVFAIAHWSLLMIPLLVFVNGLSPYFGLKTENSYAMFSNLKTENGSTNHFVMPASFQVFNYQKDVVDVVSSSDPNLQKLANANLSMVWFEFKNYLNEHRPAEVIYIRNGTTEIYRKDDKSTHPGKNNYALAKLMKFRAFNKDGAQPCSH